jgi:hypothetical protein
MRRTFRKVFLTVLAGAASWGASAQTLTDIDLGTPSIPGSTTVSNDASGGKVYTIIGGGSDIWGAGDNCHYAYAKVTGDFDYIMKVDSLVGNSGDGGWTKVELMARIEESAGVGPQGNDPFIANMTTRSSADTVNSAPAGNNNRGPQWRVNRAGNADWRTPNPAITPNIPNNWVRLERAGSAFYMYYSNDGKAWTMYQPYAPQGFDTAGMFPAGADNTTAFPGSNVTGGTDTAPWPSTIFLGVAVTAHNDGDISTAVVSHFGPYTPVPIAITQQPVASLSVVASQPLILSVAATGDPVHYQWMRNGTPLTTNGLGATLTIGVAKESDSGSYTVRVYGGGKEIISSAAVVTVTVDTAAPTLFSAKGSATFDHVTVSFSEPIDPASGTNKANYSISPSLSITGATLANLTNVVLTTAKQPSATAYTITVTGVKDLSGNVIAAGSKVSFNSFTWVSGYFAYKMFQTGVWAATAASLTTLETTVDTLIPTQVLLFNSADTPTWAYGDYYASLSEGLIVAPETGDYTFHIAADDQAQMFLSTDDTVANLATDPICQITGWDNNQDWASTAYTGNDQNPQTGNLSVPMTLTKGKQYFYRVFHVDGNGGDGTSIGWELPSAVGTISVIPGANLMVAVDANNSTVTITQQPKAVSTPQNTTASFTVEATGSSDLGNALTYQWQKNGTDIAGANKAQYTTPLLGLADSGTKFKCVLGVPAKSVTSDEVTVTVTSDSSAPRLVSAGAIKGSTVVGVTFDKLVDATSAGTAGNYTVSGATVTAATLHGVVGASGNDGKYVALTLSAAVNAAPTVTVSSVKDLAGNAMASASVTANLSSMISIDLGTPGTDPIEPGKSINLGNGGFLVAGGGDDIWNASDACQFLYQQWTGPLDMIGRVEWMNGMSTSTTASTWAKTELMVRETIDPTSRFFAQMATRNDGVNQIGPQYRDTANAAGGSATQLNGVPYPNAWLRVTRESTTNNVFNAYYSTDGVNWGTPNTYTLAGDPLPASVVVGIAVTSHDNTAGDLAEGIVQNFSIKTWAPVLDPKLAVAVQSGKVVITWASGTLVSSPTVKGTYAPVTGATSPFSVTPAPNTTMFYQVQQ